MIVPLLSALGFLTGVLVGVFANFSSTGSSFFESVWVQGVWLFCFFVLLHFVPKARLFVFPLLCLFLGIFRVDSYEVALPSVVPYGEKLTLDGRVVEELDLRSSQQNLVVRTQYGRILASVSIYETLEFGQTVRISGVLEVPSTSSYARYLARYRIWILMPHAEVDVLEEAPFSLRGLLYRFKTVLSQRLNRLYFEPEASFAAGLLLGSRKGMPEELTEAFRKTGLMHLVAISGYNISLVIAAMFLVFSFLSFQRRLLVSLFGILFFVLLVGASAAVVRAGLMGGLTLWGLYSGRHSQALFALLWSGVAMVLWNPYILTYDVGFQLSFAATLGLLTIFPLLERKIPPWKHVDVVRQAFLLTLSAQVSTLPFLAFYFGRISLLAPLTNLLVIPIIPLAMFFSALSLIFGKALALLAGVYLRLVSTLALVFAQLPWVELEVQWSVFDFVFSLAALAVLLILFYKSTLVRAFGLRGGASVSKALNLQSEMREK